MEGYEGPTFERARVDLLSTHSSPPAQSLGIPPKKLPCPFLRSGVDMLHREVADPALREAFPPRSKGLGRGGPVALLPRPISAPGKEPRSSHRCAPTKTPEGTSLRGARPGGPHLSSSASGVERSAIARPEGPARVAKRGLHSPSVRVLPENPGPRADLRRSFAPVPYLPGSGRRAAPSPPLPWLLSSIPRSQDSPDSGRACRGVRRAREDSAGEDGAAGGARGLHRNQWGWPGSPLSPGHRPQGWPWRRRSPGRQASAPHPGSAAPEPPGGELGALPPAGGPGRAGPSPSASGMLQNPGTSTPFSVDDILRLEREQIGLAALQLQEARGSPESSQYLQLVPDPRGSEDILSSGERWLDRPEPPGDPSERVADMDAERVGEYTPGAGHPRGGQEGGGGPGSAGHASPGPPRAEGLPSPPSPMSPKGRS